MRALRRFFLLLLLLITGATYVYHLGVFPKPHLPLSEVTGVQSPVQSPESSGYWIGKEKFGINQEFLFGSSFARGKRSGELTKPLLTIQEKELVGRLEHWVPSRALVQSLILFGIVWFNGAEEYLEPWQTDEMYGVSLSAPHEFDYLADGLTRQIAYHGLHEVGQLMVDQGSDDMGCTLFALPYRNSFVLGRNFDFEGGRVFDSEKVMKWVFPDQGNSYVSVIWAGMVGAVTGVNDHGIYISMNAAGSRDFKRLGTPSTLVLLKVLQFAKTAEQALAILKAEKMFITDIFVLLDSNAGKLYRIEKSPLRTEVLPLKKGSVVTNHLLAGVFESDPINIYRKNELTSGVRETRGLELLSQLGDIESWDIQRVRAKTLELIRDKGTADGKSLLLGNRRAIDALITTHSVVYDGTSQIFYVSQGPGVSGAFTGFDLKASFTQRRPVSVDILPKDPMVSEEIFIGIKNSAQQSVAAEHLIKQKKCQEAHEVLDAIPNNFRAQSGYYVALGDAFQCDGQNDRALKAWQQALALYPAYPRITRDLEKKMKEIKK